MKDLGFQKRAGFILLVVLGMVLPVYGQYGPGTGEPNNPYQIWDPNQMNAIGANPGDWGKCFKLMADIDMSRFTGTQYKIIGNSTTKFTGTFDGNDHIISNLTYITTATPYNVGLFGYTQNCTIKNLGLENIQLLSEGSYVGGLAGYNNNSIITRCYTNGLVSGTKNVGGLVGKNEFGNLTLCYVNGSVNGTDSSVGGLVGYNNYGTITSSYAMGLVNGTNEVGGIIGINYSGTIVSCYATCSVKGTGGDIGGLVGNNRGTVTSCYTTGLINGSYSVGGLLGNNFWGKINNCFWNVNTSGQMGSAGGKGLTTEQMKTMSIYQNANWANHDWVIDNGVDYPHLSWEETTGVPIPSPQPIPLAGNGTAENPYLINTAEEFALLSWYVEVLDKRIRLTTDLDLNNLKIYPIGDLGPFTGVFDGDGHIINNAIIDQSADDYVGLFSNVNSNGQIHDLGINNIYINGHNYVGGLVGKNYYGKIIRCYIKGSISGNGNEPGIFENGIGGLVGYNNYGTITASYATGLVSGFDLFGIGGLVGTNDRGLVIDSYATSVVYGIPYWVGGLVGDGCAGTVITSFWDMQISGQTSSYGGTGKTTAEMMTLGTFTGAGWDFTEGDGDGAEWMMLREGEDYPRLAWQEVYGGDIAGLYGVGMEDLLEVAGNWLEEGCPAWCVEADINEDGRVDLGDLAILAGEWLRE